MFHISKTALILLGICGAACSQAATVNWSAASDTGLITSATSGSAALAVNNYLRIGYFGTLSNSQISQDATTPAGISLLNGDFHQFAITTVGAGVSGSPGAFADSSSPLYSSLPGFNPGSQIVFWALQSSNNSSLSTALSSVTGTAIAYVPIASIGRWQFPASDVNPATTIDLSDLSNANRVVLAGNYVTGNSASLTSAFGTPNHALQLSDVTAVPEPASLIVGLFTAFAALSSRKRNRSFVI